MALDALTALRDRVRSDVAIEEFFTAHYGKAARHIVGYKRSQNAADYPAICYVPARTSNKSIVKNERISLVIGINEPAINDDVVMGFQRLSEVVDLLEPVIKLGAISSRAIILDEYETLQDFGERHPFYELEVQLKMIWRQQ